MPRCAAYLSGPRPCACCPLKSSSVVSCRHSTTDCVAILCVVCCQCGSRMARQSTFALSKKRYAAIVSLHPLHALGTLAVGVAAILSISVLARRFRRASPRSSCPNSVAVHAVDLLAICAVQKTRVNLKRPQFTRGAGKSLNVKDFFRASDAGYRLVYNEVGLTPCAEKFAFTAKGTRAETQYRYFKSRRTQETMFHVSPLSKKIYCGKDAHNHTGTPWASNIPPSPFLCREGRICSAAVASAPAFRPQHRPALAKRQFTSIFMLKISM